MDQALKTHRPPVSAVLRRKPGSDYFDDALDIAHAPTPGPQRATPHEHHHVAGFDLILLERGHRVLLVSKYPGLTRFAIHAVRIQHARVNRGAFDHGTFRSEIAARKSHRAAQAALARLV